MGDEGGRENDQVRYDEEEEEFSARLSIWP